MTWSIIARDEATGRVGIIVATRFFAVGALVPHIKTGVGAVATQAFVNPCEGRVGDVIRRTPYPRFERRAGEPEGFCRTEDWPHISRHRVRTVPLKTGHSMRRLIKIGIADVA